MNKHTRRAEIYWNCHHVEKRGIDPILGYEVGSLPVEYSPWTKWDGWPDTGKIAVPKLIFNLPETYICSNNSKPSMDCCDEIQGKIDKLQKELTQCRLEKTIQPVLVHAKEYFQHQDFVAQVNYNDESAPNSILVDIKNSTMSDVTNYISAHPDLYLYNIYKPTLYHSHPPPTENTFARIVISFREQPSFDYRV